MAVAVLVDFPNIYLGAYYNYLNPPPQTMIAEFILNYAKNFGDIIIRQVYGDWNDPRNSGFTQYWKGYRPKQVTKKNIGKDRTDLTLSLDALELCYNKSVDYFCIGSGDADYVDVTERIIAHPDSKKVTFFAIEKTMSPDLLDYSQPSPMFLEHCCNVAGYELIELFPIMGLCFNMYLFHKEKNQFLGANKFRKTLISEGICTEEKSFFILKRLFDEGIFLPDYIDNPLKPGYKTKAILINGLNPIVKFYAKKMSVTLDV